MPYHPLWKRERRDLLIELLKLGFKPTIISIKDDILDKKFLGTVLDIDVITEFDSIGIDASGEEGEYHTVVTDGPIFATPLKLDMKKQVLRDGYRFLDVGVLQQ
ncbi:MAG: hypothetical protein ABIH39_02970 [Candidatus Margulisiibacteriota bacterium]